MPKGVENWRKKTDNPAVMEWENKKTGEGIQLMVSVENDVLQDIMDEHGVGRDRAMEICAEDSSCPKEWEYSQYGSGFPVNLIFYDSDEAMGFIKDYMRKFKDKPKTEAERFSRSYPRGLYGEEDKYEYDKKRGY